MRKFILVLLLFFSVVVLLLRFGVKPLEEFLGVKTRSGLRVSSNIPSKVFLGGKEVGNTPYQDENLSEGEVVVGLKPTDSTDSKVFWSGYVKLNGGTVSFVNRDLNDSPSLQSGEVITLDKGKGVAVVSSPFGAKVSIDGKEVGVTPISVSNLESGEHQFLVLKDNFVNRSIRATLVSGYKLTMSVDLALAEADLTKLQTVPVTQSKQVTIKQTPTGFLRVREKASVSSLEVGRVNPGEVLVVLEEVPSWVKVKLPDGKEGYIASEYTEKKN